MAHEILEALRREGFIDRDANTVGFELFNGVWLQAWAHDTRLVSHFYVSEMYEEIYFPSLSTDRAGLEDVARLVQLKNLLYVAE